MSFFVFQEWIAMLRDQDIGFSREKERQLMRGFQAVAREVQQCELAQLCLGDAIRQRKAPRLRLACRELIRGLRLYLHQDHFQGFTSTTTAEMFDGIDTGIFFISSDEEACLRRAMLFFFNFCLCTLNFRHFSGRLSFDEILVIASDSYDDLARTSKMSSDECETMFRHAFEVLFRPQLAARISNKKVSLRDRQWMYWAAEILDLDAEQARAKSPRGQRLPGPKRAKKSAA
jgi:hypothetical protein